MPTNYVVLDGVEGTWSGGVVKTFVPLGPPPFVPARTLGATCACGCLLKTRSERCPACLVSAERDAIRASWAYAETVARAAICELLVGAA